MQKSERVHYTQPRVTVAAVRAKVSTVSTEDLTSKNFQTIFASMLTDQSAENEEWSEQRTATSENRSPEGARDEEFIRPATVYWDAKVVRLSRKRRETIDGESK